MRRRRGSSALETALWAPILILFLMGTFEIGRVTYTYYQLKKILYSVARYVGTQQGVNFCDSADPVIAAAKTFAVTGTSDGSAESILAGLQPDNISIRIERYTRETGTVGECECSATAYGCDTAQGAGSPPDFLVVSIPDGYPVTLRIPNLLGDAIPLKPVVRVPYGGT